MTKKTYSTYFVPAAECHRHDCDCSPCEQSDSVFSQRRREVHHKFECECGKQQRADNWTECTACGAHYKLVEDQMIQIAPPLDVWEN